MGKKTKSKISLFQEGKKKRKEKNGNVWEFQEGVKKNHEKFKKTSEMFFSSHNFSMEKKTITLKSQINAALTYLSLTFRGKKREVTISMKPFFLH
jgi:hypothetical protein